MFSAALMMLVWLAPWFRSCRGRAVVLGLAVGFLRGFDHTRGGVCRRRAGLAAARLARVRRARGVVPLIGSGSGELGPRADGGGACYVRFMARVRSALGQFYGSVRSALGHVRSVLWQR